MNINKFMVLVAALVVSVCSSAQEVNGITYQFDKDKKEAMVVAKYIQGQAVPYKGAVNIPESVTYGGVTYKVTSISNSTFGGNSELTSVTIPNTVVSIGLHAFISCTGLKSLTIPASVSSVGSGAFESCSNLTSFVVDKDNKFFDSRDNCNALINTRANELVAGFNITVIPNTVTKIGANAFQGSEITSIVIPNSVTSIAPQAFYCCENLKSVTLSDNLKTIGHDAFSDCISLESINLPSSLTKIDEYAFEACQSLKEITLPAKLQFINEGAFKGCSSLTSVTNLATTPLSIYYRTFTTFGKLIVPEGSEEAYRNMPVWKDFTIISDVTMETGIDNLPSPITQHPSPIFALSGKRLDKASKGVNIINGKKYILK
jgi:Flp pilus assembly protein protease CpaA